MNLALLSPRIYRQSLLSCAGVWMVVGLFLSRIGDTLVAGQRPSMLTVILFGLLVLNGVLGLRDLLGAAERLTEPPPSRSAGA